MNRTAVKHWSMIKLGRINVSIFSVLGCICILSADFSVCTLLIPAAIILHEGAHLFCLHYFGVGIKRISIYPFGIDIAADTRIMSYKAELVSILAGPFANLVAAAISFAAFKYLGGKEVLFFSYMNLILGCGNLIPISGFDGSRAAKLIFESLFLPEKAYAVWRVFSAVSYVLFFAFSVFVIVFSKCNFSVIIAIAYAALCSVILDRVR